MVYNAVYIATYHQYSDESVGWSPTGGRVVCRKASLGGPGTRPRNCHVTSKPLTCRFGSVNGGKGVGG